MLPGLSKELIKEIVDFGLVIVNGTNPGCPLILEGIKEAQRKNVGHIRARDEEVKQFSSDFKVRPDVTLLFKGHTCIPDIPEIKEQLLEEAHQTPYSVPSGVTKNI